MAGRPLRPATDRCFGEPLPHQQANQSSAAPLARGPCGSPSFFRRTHAVLANLSAGCPPRADTFRCITHPFATRRRREASFSPRYRFDPDKIDWDSVKAFGLTKDKLVKANVLDTLLQGYKSPGLHYVSVHLGGAVLNSDARLSLRERKDGTIYMAIEGVKRKPEFHFPFMGHEFSDDDAKNLAQTKNMGRIVDLVHPNTGEIVPSIISVDHLTNGFVACPAEKIRVPDEIGNLKLTNEQKAELSQGKAVYLEGMISKKGEPFDCPVQFNAEKRYVEYLFEDRGKLAIEAHKELHKNDIPHEFRGKEITDEQHKKLEQGGSVYLSGIEIGRAHV